METCPRMGQNSEVESHLRRVRSTRKNRHQQFDWVASRNIGSQLGLPGLNQSERDASQLLRWRQCCDPNGFLLYRSRASLRRPQRFSFRDGSNTRSACRFRALITPIRANMVGPPRSATSMSASIAACHSGSAASFFGRPVTYVAASRSVRSFSPSGRTIGSSNSRDHPSERGASQLLRLRT
jgi:hypothetical protein